MELDLNARRAARAEVADHITVQFGFDDEGKPLAWQISHEIPLDAIELLQEGRMAAALTLLLADADDVDAFMVLRPTVADLNEIIEAITGSAVGNSPASVKPSKSTGKR